MSLQRTPGIAGAVLLVVVAAIVGGLFLYTQHLYRDSYSSDYHYQVRVSPSDPVTNLTVMVPLPTHGGQTPFEPADLRHPFTPNGWRYAVVDTEYGPMLRIEADAVPAEPTYHTSVVRNDRLVRWERLDPGEYDPDNASHLRATHDDVDIDTHVESEDPIDTGGALDTEPLPRPHEDRMETACFMATGEEETCYSYTGRVFVSHDGAPDTAVYVSIEIWGTNSWWVFGWNGNDYIDRQSVEVVGSPDGWLGTDGELETGQGNYRKPPG